MTVQIVRGDARQLPLADNTVDLVVTSPPYFALRSYTDTCVTCDGVGRSSRPDSHGIKVCPDCGYEADRKRCNRCGASMKWPPKQPAPELACVDCGGTGQRHYDGQIGSEATPTEWLDALLEVTAECVRVLKPSGSLFVNLGDKYAAAQMDGKSGWHTYPLDRPKDGYSRPTHERMAAEQGNLKATAGGVRPKSLMGLPWRYALACIDQLGLILRAEIVWAKPNGLPESVMDRVRRSHETWFHLVQQPRYYSAVDEIRETQTGRIFNPGHHSSSDDVARLASGARAVPWRMDSPHPLGKLPGSVWTIPSEPLSVPAGLGVDHFAAFPLEWPRRIIRGWSPAAVCSGCGEGRRPVAAKDYALAQATNNAYKTQGHMGGVVEFERKTMTTTITGYVCACTPHTDHPGTPNPERSAAQRATPEQGRHKKISGLTVDDRTGPVREYHFDRWNPPPTTPGVVLDPFGGTGTTALAAHALGRHAIHVDLSADYNRIAEWRTTDRDQLAKAMQVERGDRAREADLFDMEALF